MFLLCIAIQAHAQSELAAQYFKEARTTSKNQKLWKLPLYGPMLFVDRQTRMTYANMPDSTGILKPEGEIFIGTLPESVMVANTAIHWGGRTWSVILWPLPNDSNERLNLILHESFHRVQEDLGFPGKSPTADHLSSMQGRVYFLLELKALETALKKPVNKRQADLANALGFRYKRQKLFPKTFGNERILEMNEGLAEYTGAVLGRNDLRQHLYSQVDTAGNRKSFIRSFAYLTGPLYGLLLQEKAPDWTHKLDSTADFPKLIGLCYKVKPSTSPNEHLYNGEAIRASEQEKEDARLQKVADYVTTFTCKPVLTIKLIKMNILFNPNTLFDLGSYGTVYPTGEISDTWGYLKVNHGGMLLKDWHIITVPFSSPLNFDSKTIKEDGWTLNLAYGWRVIKTDDLHYTLKQDNKQ